MNTAFVAVAALGSVRGAPVGGSPGWATTGSEGYLVAAFRHVNLVAVKRYGEALSGALIAVVGVAFWLWPAL
jgi:hypothetical protein